MYLLCLEYSDYIKLKEAIVDYFERTLGEHIEFDNHYLNEFDDYMEYTRCSLFSMYIESEYTSKECEPEFTLEDYKICTNISVYIKIYTDKIIESIHFLNVLIKNIEELFQTNIVVLDDSSAVVYISSSSKYYINKSFWSQKGK